MSPESRNETTLVHPESAAASRPVFISYASHDAAVAQKVCSALEAAGFSCWIAPRNVVPGTLYADGIVHAIDESSILVLILSEQAIASAHVGREIERAVSKRHPVVALRIDAAPLTAAFEYFLNQSQWIEGGGSDAAIAQLVGAVGQHLAPGAAIPPTNPNHASALHRKVATPRRAWVIAGVVGAVALAGGYFLVDKAWLSKHEAVAVVSNNSIAVLPFVDMSEKKDQEYFADGMAEEILDLLVKIPELKVVGRTSSFQFKGQSQDLRAIGEKLGAHYVLEGSVRKSGDRLRVTAQLINSRDGTHLWSQSYDRELSDVLKMQDEIAAKVARALEVEVGTRDYFVSRPALRNTEAYTLYLRASHSSDRYEPEGWEQAISAAQRALELDPTFAEAAAGLAGFYEFGGLVGYLPPALAFEKSRQAADRAIKLDPKLAKPYAILGDIANVYDWDWAAADQETKRALARAPNAPGVLTSAAYHSLTQGRSDDALEFVNSVVDLDPLDPGGYFFLSIVQARRSRLAEAEAAIRRALELTPTYTFGPYILGVVLLARKQPQAALEAFLKEPSAAGRLNGSAMAYFALGDKAESDAALAQSIKDNPSFAVGIAQVYAFRGESDEAFKWLDRAYAQKDALLYTLKFELSLDSLHGDPRYKAFLKKMNLPE
jgi:TolB-like protein/Flp pilus assembly protein TadD